MVFRYNHKTLQENKKHNMKLYRFENFITENIDDDLFDLGLSNNRFDIKPYTDESDDLVYANDWIEDLRTCDTVFGKPISANGKASEMDWEIEIQFPEWILYMENDGFKGTTVVDLTNRKTDVARQASDTELEQFNDVSFGDSGFDDSADYITWFCSMVASVFNIEPLTENTDYEDEEIATSIGGSQEEEYNSEEYADWFIK